jgi:hypothetical protein
MTPDMARLLNRAAGRCDEPLMAESQIAERLMNARAEGISIETILQAFCNLSLIRISFTFIFFAIFTWCFESNAGDQ